MTSNRLRFRAFFEDATFYDDDGNEYTKSFYLYDVAIYENLDCGISKDDLESQLKEQGFSEKEIRRIEEDEFDNWECEWFYFSPSVIEQCTGLKDKNGKLIYEGDVLGGLFGGYVKWCDRCKSFELFFDNECASCNGDIYWYEIVEDDGKYEVIGNVHENPELMND